MKTDHPDFTGRVTGDQGDNDLHGTHVTGFAAAQGNNAIGIAGIAWNVGILNEDVTPGIPGSSATTAAAIRSAYERGAHVTNNSWGSGYNVAIRKALADGYRLGRIAVAAMGNGGVLQENQPTYPAGFGQCVVAVGGTTNEDVRASYSIWGDWIDAAAPMDGMREAGPHHVRLEAGALPAGVYVVHLMTGTVALSRRMTRIR